MGEIPLVFRNFLRVFLRRFLHSLLQYGKVDGDHLHPELLHQLALVPDDREEGRGTGPKLTDAHPAEIFDHADNAHETVKALPEFRRFHPTARQMRERDVKPLQLPRHAEQPALRVGRAHSVRIVFVIQRCPQKDRLAERLCDIRRRFLVSEIAVDDHHRVHILPAKPLNDRLRTRRVKNQVMVSQSALIGKADVTVCKVAFDVINVLFLPLFGGIPGQKRSARAVCGVAPHGDKTDFYPIVKHDTNPPILQMSSGCRNPHNQKSARAGRG